MHTSERTLFNLSCKTWLANSRWVENPSVSDGLSFFLSRSRADCETCRIRLFTDQVPHRKSPPIFLTGDFNSETGQEAYNEMTSSTSPMADLQMMVPENKRYGDFNTFTGFDSKDLKRIDFIFVNKVDPSLANRSSKRDNAERWWLVEGYAVLPNRFEDGMYNSDHQVVVGDVSIM